MSRLHALVCSSVLALVGTAHLAAAAPQVILDTDFALDVDDVGALAVAHQLDSRGDIELIGVIGSTDSLDTAAAIDVVNTFFGKPDLPVAVNGPSRSRGRYARALIDEFPHDTASDNVNQDTTALYRRLLDDAPDNGVKIVVTGWQSELSKLLDSPADYNGDGIALTGAELVANKVSELVIAGGNFQSPNRRDVNIRKDIDAARNVADRWPTPKVYAGARLAAEAETGSALFDPAVDEPGVLDTNPVARAYQLHGRTDDTQPNLDRQSGAQAAVLYAATGTEFDGQTIWELSNELDIDFASPGETLASGKTTQAGGETVLGEPTPGTGERYLGLVLSNEELAAILTELMTAPAP